RYIPKENRGKAFGLIGSIVAMGEGVGPAIGGMIAHYIHWSYLLLIPMITIITVPFLMKLLKKEVRIKGHFDIKGIILMSVGRSEERRVGKECWCRKWRNHRSE